MAAWYSKCAAIVPEAADIASKAPASSTAAAPPSRSNNALAASPPGWTGVTPARRATGGSGIARASSPAAPTIAASSASDTPAITLITGCSGRKRSSPRIARASCGRSDRTSVAQPSTTAWLSAATATEG